MPHILITGANRGIGLEFARAYAADGWTVHAGARNPDDASLIALEGVVHRHRLDVTDLSAIASVAAAVEGPLDIVIANAGVHARAARALGAIDYNAFDDAFAVNVRGLVATAAAFAPHLRAARGRFAGITSLMGSIGDASSGSLGYRTTKAAANMACAMIAAEFVEDGVAAAPFHPGWVQTDMGGAQAPVSVAQSVAGLRQQIAAMQPTAKPDFVDYTGKRLPW